MSRLPPALSVEGLHFGFRGRALIDGLSFELKSGEILSLLGPNGVGKTTALRLISGILPLRQAGGSGVVRYLGQDLLALPPWERASRVAYLPAEVKAEFPLTALEIVQLGRIGARFSLFGELSEVDRDRVRSAMERTSCWDMRDRDYHTLSGGERQLVCFARGLAQEAKVLLLDESFSRLDLHHQSKIGRLLRVLASEGHAFVIVSHDLNFILEYSTSCLVWPRDGSMKQGTVQEVITDARMKSLYPGAEVFTAPNPRTGALQIFFDRS